MGHTHTHTSHTVRTSATSHDLLHRRAKRPHATHTHTPFLCRSIPPPPSHPSARIMANLEVHKYPQQRGASDMYPHNTFTGTNTCSHTDCLDICLALRYRGVRSTIRRTDTARTEGGGRSGGAAGLYTRALRQKSG
mmetsp:Transcript_39001/g.111451  ORF Transcript_39001/g.111451 Transcript_39001/m.111451 type:complete len:136 (+) Transcript_39001:3318-3725(+)